ncbi:sigma-70 family RNA polymerase sigma factor [Massilia atriviolacea]|uniref:Sigma-70 family RNA polymerase sigma factor n=1 Tax=Massilia atriviolacea TaxID=2495579 RepID=A0A430HNJ3_9BURK|nr:sigma-70 family RNA polymerase sigma factor [Massilia atriviolacea]RSZ59071.1 sigma-70 family RNA polymerase sigma factor [Massilia atriviolacea]
MFERYHHELLNFLHRLLGDRHAAADLAQESYVRVLLAQQSGRAIANARALLYRTARNLVIDTHRRAGVRGHDALDAIADHAGPVHLQPDEALASDQSVQAYLRAIEDLPPRCREAFILHVFDDMSHKQIAERMGISASMVEKHIVRGMLACRACERSGA